MDMYELCLMIFYVENAREQFLIYQNLLNLY